MNWPLPFRDAPVPGHRRWLLACVAALVGILAFAVTGHAVRRAVDAFAPPPAVEEITLKLDWYRDHKDSIDTIFIGTSRIFFSLDPRVFDAATAAAGCPTHSFNMALAGLNFRELLLFMQRIADDPPPRLKLVLFEPRPSPGRDLEEMMSPRRRLTMDADTLAASIAEGLANPRQGDRALEFLGYYLAGWFYHNLGMGTVSERLIDPKPPESPDQPEWAEDRRGHRPLGLQQDGSVQPHDPRFMEPKRLSGWQKEVAGYRPQTRNTLHPGWRQMLDAYLDIVDRIPARTVILLPPHAHWFSRAFVKLAQDVRPDMPIVYFDPLSHPELYTVDGWYDDGHLNQVGGRRFAEDLAAVACGLIDGSVAGTPPATTTPSR